MRRMSSRWIRRVWVLVGVVYVGVCLWAFAVLPERPWTHFGGLDGAGDAQMSKVGNLLVSLVLGAALIGGLPLIGRALAANAQFGLNVPDADYWLAPERIEQTKAGIVGDMVMMSTLLGLLLIGAEVSIVAANRRQPAAMGPEAFVLMGTFVVGMVVWLVHSRRRYRRVPAAG